MTTISRLGRRGRRLGAPLAAQAQHWPRPRPRPARTGTAICAPWRSSITIASAWSGKSTTPASSPSSVLPRNWSAWAIRWRRASMPEPRIRLGPVGGVDGTLKQLLQAFEKAGIKVIDPMGLPFDPPGMRRWSPRRAGIRPQYRIVRHPKGLLLERPVLRPARVIVSKAPGGDAN